MWKRREIQISHIYLGTWLYQNNTFIFNKNICVLYLIIFTIRLNGFGATSYIYLYVFLHGHI